MDEASVVGSESAWMLLNVNRCGIGVIAATGHPKRGDKTPGVHRPYWGESGKIDNCVVAQHLLFTDNDAVNPFACVLASDLYLPQCWASDPDRRKEAGIPEELAFGSQWTIALDQLRDAIAGGVKLSQVVFDEDYGRIPGLAHLRSGLTKAW